MSWIHSGANSSRYGPYGLLPILSVISRVMPPECRSIIFKDHTYGPCYRPSQLFNIPILRFSLSMWEGWRVDTLLDILHVCPLPNLCYRWDFKVEAFSAGLPDCLPIKPWMRSMGENLYYVLIYTLLMADLHNQQTSATHRDGRAFGRDVRSWYVLSVSEHPQVMAEHIQAAMLLILP